MPIYEYKCENCGKHIECIQKVSDAALVECPECGKPTLHRMVSAPAFQLKGSGWYVTDFRDKKTETRKTEPKTENTKTKTDTTETKTSETKTETKKTDE